MEKHGRRFGLARGDACRPQYPASAAGATGAAIEANRAQLGEKSVKKLGVVHPSAQENLV
jgi:hypothetical protein